MSADPLTSRASARNAQGARRGAQPGARPPGAQDGARRRAARERLMLLTRLLDTAFYVPVLRTRAGLDAVLGLIPGIGDLISAGLGLYLVMEARQLGASRWLQARMVGNLLIDAAAGTVPLIGDLFDVYFKAHLRNLKLLQKELGEPYIDGGADAGGGGSGGPAARRDEVIDVEPIEAPRR